MPILSPAVDAATWSDIVALAWEAFIIDVPLEGDQRRHPRDEVVTASIVIGGPWTATLVLTANRSLLVPVAVALFGTPEGPDGCPEDADLFDALGELANIAGGNIKGIVSGESEGWSLSLPIVSAGTQAAPGGVVIACAAFRAPEGQLLAELYEPMEASR